MALKKTALLEHLSSINAAIIYGIIIGMSFPNISTITFPLLYYLVIFTFFIAIVETPNLSNKTENKITIQYQLMTHITKLILIPISLFYLLSYGQKITTFLSHSIVLGMALKFTSAPTFALPEITALLNGNIKRSLLFTIKNNIISIITTPAILCLLTERPFEISYILPIATYIVKIIVPPLVLGKMAIQFCPKTINQCKPYMPTASKIAVLILVTAACNGLDSEILRKPYQTLLISILSCVIYIALALLGWILEPSKKKADKLFLSLFIATPSTTPILFAHMWFPSNKTIIACTVISTILYPTASITCKKLHSLNKAKPHK